jgi:hypothetical protein
MKGMCPHCRTVVEFISLDNTVKCPSCGQADAIDYVPLWFKGDGKRIECASIREKATGKYYIGQRHYQIMQAVDEDCNRLLKDCHTNAIDQGFVTDAGDFVDREEAYKIAVASGQYKRDNGSTLKILFSEDLY